VLFCLTDKRQPDALVTLFRLSEGYDHCDRFCCSRHPLLNLHDAPFATQRWQIFGRSAGLALTGRAGKETPYIILTKNCRIDRRL